nr:protein FLX-like 1 [Tanacetum cinerariifolium]GEV60444.1 protein FLX-like 1 [Tanacetum cinerariifolium]
MSLESNERFCFKFEATAGETRRYATTHAQKRVYSQGICKKCVIPIVEEEWARYKEAMKLVYNVGSSSLQGGAIPIFKALENFTCDALKAHGQLVASLINATVPLYYKEKGSQKNFKVILMEKDMQLWELYENLAKMEHVMHGGEGMRAELMEVHADVKELMTTPQKVTTQV